MWQFSHTIILFLAILSSGVKLFVGQLVCIYIVSVGNSIYSFIVICTYSNTQGIAVCPIIRYRERRTISLVLLGTGVLDV